MRSFSPTDAAFAGFRLIRDNPLLVVMWTLFSFAAALGAIVLLFLFMGSAFMSLAQMGPNAEPSPEEAMGLFARMIPAFLLLVPLALIYSGMLIAGVNRAIMNPSDKGFFYLKIGGEELRQSVILLVQGLAWFGLYMVGALIFFLTVGAGAFAASAGGGGAESIGPAIGIAVVVGLAMLALALFLAVKFSLASSQSFHKGAIDIFGTWQLTNGRFWPMLGAFLLALVFWVMLYVVLFVLQMAVQSVALGGDMVTTIVSMVFTFLVSSVVGTVMHIVLYSVAPSIYKQIAVTDDQSAVFA